MPETKPASDVVPTGLNVSYRSSDTRSRHSAVGPISAIRHLHRMLDPCSRSGHMKHPRMSFGSRRNETAAVPAYKANQPFRATPVLPGILQSWIDEKSKGDKPLYQKINLTRIQLDIFNLPLPFLGKGHRFESCRVRHPSRIRRVCAVAYDAFGSSVNQPSSLVSCQRTLSSSRKSMEWTTTSSSPRKQTL